MRETRVLWAFSFKYYIHSKKKKEKKRKNLSIRSSPSQHARDLLEEQEWGWNNPPSRIPLPRLLSINVALFIPWTEFMSRELPRL